MTPTEPPPRRGGSAVAARATLAGCVGAGAAAAYVRRGFRFAPGQRCGDHDPREYLRRVDEMRAVFARLDAPPEALDAAGQ